MPQPELQAPQDDAGLSVSVIEDVDALGPHLIGWDALAVSRELPFCAPGWMLAWWRVSRTDRMRLRVILVHDRDRQLVGVAPFFASMTWGLAEMRLLSAGFAHRIGILGKSGSEARIAQSVAEALAGLRPASVVFEGVENEDPWPGLIAGHWPSGHNPLVRTDGSMEAPIIRLDGSYDKWFERRERRFRKEAGRLRRRLQEQQVSTRIDADEQAIEALLKLHHARWESRGGSNVEGTARAVLLEASRSLPAPDRLFVAMLESPSGPVAAELVVRAGDTAVFWGGGFDPEWSQYGPGMQAMLFTLGFLAEAGVDTADLGGGSHSYKRRLADETTTLVWRTVFPRGWRYPLIRLRLAPKHLRLGLRKIAQRMPPSWQERLKAARAALRRSG
jgi:CelD/BcsL family acetyltransferase involved in cellulose biosynthesis